MFIYTKDQHLDPAPNRIPAIRKPTQLS